MELFKTKTNIDFLGKRYIWVGISLLINSIAIFMWFSQGDEKYGVDFRGGTEIVVRFGDTVGIAELRQAMEKEGFKEAIVQSFENASNDFSIRVGQDESTKEAKQKLTTLLETIRPGKFSILKEDFVGPVIGEQIRRDGMMALIFSFIAMFVYITLRFDWRYALGGIFALFHDVIFVVGVCLFLHKSFNAGILAALLTIIGYSINDTIVIFDRIRENINKFAKSGSGKRVSGEKPMTLMELMNLSVNETLSRSILTSLTAIFVVTVLWLMGGGAVVDMSFALMVGFIVGCYSTVFIACPIVLALQPKT